MKRVIRRGRSRYKFEGFEKSKTAAKADARKWRKLGYKCRVVKAPKSTRRIEGEPWAIYLGAKRRR